MSTVTDESIVLLGIGTAVPRSVLQALSAAMGEPLSCESDQHRAWLKRIFSRNGIDRRGSVLQTSDDLSDVTSIRDFYPIPTAATDRGPGTGQRMDRYATEAPPLAMRAVTEALAAADVPAGRITHLVTVSCTGFSAPGLDVQLIKGLSLSPSVHRLHVGFMGCHAAFNAIGAARSIVAGNADAVVLVCCVELCSLHFAYGWSPDKVIANSLFADGAAAAVVGRVGNGRTSTGWRVRETASLLLPDSTSAMTWRIGDNGFEMTLSAEVPTLVEKHLRSWCQEWLGNCGVSVADIAHWAVHPGGPKILTSAASALNLDKDALATSRAILANYGNMSSTTILFILQQMGADHAKGKCVALGFGPGLMMEGLLLER